MRSRSLLVLAGLTTVVVTAAAAPAVAVSGAAGASLVARPHSVMVHPASAGHVVNRSKALATPPTTAQCETKFGIACYSPVQLEQAYNVKPLWNSGITGRGVTIVLADAFGSPTIQHDLDVFSATYGLPSTTVEIQQPSGTVNFDPTNADEQGWAFESTLDVEYAHAMAPEAHLVLMETPVSETEGLTGLPELMNGEQSLIKRGIGDVISQSFGATENTFNSPQEILNLRYAFKAAQRKNVTVMASSGDAGSTDAQLDGTTLYPYRVTSWPTADPLVTSVGGTMLHLDANGTRTSADTVWNDGYGAGGGGLSTVFSRPAFQDGVKAQVGNRRGVPDVSLSAAVDGGAIVYITGDPNPANNGFFVVGGTSEASPLFAGIVALADQAAGKRLGNINSALYELATKSSARSGIVDVTKGNNGFGGVPGFTAKAGYDLASGVGTVNAAVFVKALAKASRTPNP